MTAKEESIIKMDEGSKDWNEFVSTIPIEGWMENPKFIVRITWAGIVIKFKESIGSVEDHNFSNQCVITSEILNFIKGYRQSKLGSGTEASGIYNSETEISILLSNGATKTISVTTKKYLKEILVNAERVYNIAMGKKGTSEEQGFIGDMIKFSALCNAFKARLLDIRFINNTRTKQPRDRGVKRRADGTEKDDKGTSISFWGIPNNMSQLCTGLRWPWQQLSGNQQACGIGTCLIEYAEARESMKRSWARTIEWKLGAWPIANQIKTILNSGNGFKRPEIGAICRYAAVFGTRDRRRYAYPLNFILQRIVSGDLDFTFSNIKTLSDYNSWALGVKLQEDVAYIVKLAVSGMVYDDGALIEQVCGQFRYRYDCNAALAKIHQGVLVKGGKKFAVADSVGRVPPILNYGVTMSSAQFMHTGGGVVQCTRNPFISGYARSNLDKIKVNVLTDSLSDEGDLIEIVNKRLQDTDIGLDNMRRGNSCWYAWDGQRMVSTKTDAAPDGIEFHEDGRLFFDKK